ncbi:unnamed protein product [Adineta ricciae]|uniref:Uncharacterized protein n=1 Tax=Adineta ricciae TaxID=249248 RepID=A0A815VXA1_ADIRI|nr:unnamed protein product [Adineta ricciae]
MHSNIVLRVADTRLSPQTISSSGYHSDLSSTNDSPGSSHRNRHEYVEYYASIPVRTKIQTNKMTSLSQISNFLRKQYERAKSKFLSEKHHSSTIKTSTKATSTTPVPYLTDSIHRPSMISKYKQSSFIEPVRSVYVRPLHDNTLKKGPPRDYNAIHECYSQRLSHQLTARPKFPQNPIDCSHYRPTMVSNLETLTAGCCRPTFRLNKSIYSQHYYPYKYINKNYDYHSTLYAPLSDFISTTDSAFKPIKVSRQQSFYHRAEPIPPSDDPCDLEVAHYLCPTPQWSNPNYFDIYNEDIPRIPPRKTYTETLC